MCVIRTVLARGLARSGGRVVVLVVVLSTRVGSMIMYSSLSISLLCVLLPGCNADFDLPQIRDLGRQDSHISQRRSAARGVALVLVFFYQSLTHAVRRFPHSFLGLKEVESHLGEDGEESFGIGHAVAGQGKTLAVVVQRVEVLG